MSKKSSWDETNSWVLARASQSRRTATQQRLGNGKVLRPEGMVERL